MAKSKAAKPSNGVSDDLSDVQMKLKPVEVKAPQTPPKEANAPVPAPQGSGKLLLGFAMLYAAVYAATRIAGTATPVPLPADAPLGVFAEGRAMATTSRLADRIGHRQISTPGEAAAAEYLLAQAHSIAADAARDRPDLEVTVASEKVKGALGSQRVFGVDIANVYNGLTNIVLRMAPKGSSSATGAPRSLLINAHYDSALGSPGASDAASCIGVALEIARTIVANATLDLAAPIVFLFNGGEETLMQASHGFMASSRFAAQLGAFINLESTGPWGPDVLFQHSGDWPLRAYARVAPHPRGTTVGQDFFDAGLIPADTDFRMFSHAHYGTLPGIDVAFLFDATAYHTVRDEVSRIRTGTLQGMGDNTLAAALEFARVLAQQAQGAATAPPLGDGSADHGDVFFDVLSRCMVVYNHKTAAILHHIPLAALLVLSLQAAASGSEWACTVPPPAALLSALLAAVKVVAVAVLVPALLAGLRVALMHGSIPLRWYGNEVMGMYFFLPGAAVGVLAPFTGLIMPSPSVTPEHARTLSLGFALLASLIACALTAIGMHSGYLFVAWAGGALAAALLLPEDREWRRNKDHGAYSLRAVATLCACFAVPVLVCLPTPVSIVPHIMEKMGMTGGVAAGAGAAIPDAVIGALWGVGAVLLLGAALPYLATALGESRVRLLVNVLLVVIAASWVDWRAPGTAPPQHPYSYDHPKRLLVQHVHRHTPQGAIAESFFSFSSLDAIPVDSVLPQSILNLTHKAWSSSDWEGFYPMSKMVTGVSRAAPGPAQSAKRLPTLRQTWGGAHALRSLWGSSVGAPRQADGHRRWHFELDTVLPCWAVLNVSGPVHAWSLGPNIASEGASHMVRYSSGYGEPPRWRFWVDLPAGVPLRIELFVKHLGVTPDTQALLDAIPDYVSAFAVTTWHSVWEFK